MRAKQSFPVLVALACFSGTLHAQPWSGILAPSRAIDWSRAGIPGGPPSASWTQCGSTIASGASAATINAALAACAPNHFVLLGPGTFSGGIRWTKNNVALRGSGADQTFIQGSGAGTCPGGFGFNAMVVMCTADSSPNIGQGASFNWTAGYAKGATSLTFNSTAGIIASQSLVFLDQCDDGYSGTTCTGSNADTGNYFVCSDGNCDSEGEGTNAYRNKRAQIQIVVPTNVSGTTVTIPSPGLYAPQWRSGQNPGAWIIAQPLLQAGLENLSIDTTTTGADGVLIWGAYQPWVSGVRVIMPAAKSAIRVIMSSHFVLQNNYVIGPQFRPNDPYGFQFQITADGLVLNNIIQEVASPFVTNGPDTGSVFAYNFTVLNNSGSQGSWSFWNHSSGVAYQLWEGNSAAGFANDNIHGTHNMITKFRNRFTGKESTNTQQLNPIFEGAFNRYNNIVGNILGLSSGGLQTLYQADFNNPSNMIYVIGWGNTLPDDSITVSSTMRWGNWDNVTNNVRYCTAASTPISACTASERAESAPTYPGLASPSTTLPPSFFYSARPAWWPATKTWPPIGPDVSGGNVANVSGHAYTIPAQDCFLNVMGGLSSGSGSALGFNANSCYTGAQIVAPTPQPNVSSVFR